MAKREDPEARRERFEKMYSEPALHDARRCPFCGKHILGVAPADRGPIIPRESWRVFCSTCYAYGPPCDTPEGAVMYWNGRREDRPPRPR